MRFNLEIEIDDSDAGIDRHYKTFAYYATSW